MSASGVNDTWIVTSFGAGDIPGQPHLWPAPHVGDHFDVAMDVLAATPAAREPDPDQALITASGRTRRASPGAFRPSFTPGERTDVEEFSANDLAAVGGCEAQ